jgi:prepilin-type N-terminal cleavage/methylation domain-containing protein
MARKLERSRAGFTLVEALVVVSILVILAALTTAAVVRALQSAEDARVVAEIRQLENGVAAFKAEFGVDYMPSHIKLFNNLAMYQTPNLKNTDPVAYETRQFLSRMFPRMPQSGTIGWSQSGSGTYELFGPECLVFFLGGRNGTEGFSKNPNDPWNGAGNRTKPSFDFDTKRLKLSQWTPGFLNYIDGYFNGSPEDKPYFYFTSRSGNDYSAADAINHPASFTRIAAFRDQNNRFINPNSFQIVSAGRDKRVGNFNLLPANPFVVWQNGSFGTASVPGFEKDPQDNLSNFHPVKLGIPQ